ncbi:MAG: carboxy terminal-processing peptidase [Desulfobulbaceae bacterium]|nr:carboxy terminal-processing peptidase [Desulfobulbaceae bacterium]
MRIKRVIILYFFTFIFASNLYGKVMPAEFDASRNRLIAYILSHQLSIQHFEHKAVNDDLSRDAFKLYLEQLDPRKHFLLTTDVEQLSTFSTQIDDELLKGNTLLPDAGALILKERIKAVSEIVERLYANGFDFNKEEYLEVDPDKSGYPSNPRELAERWRKLIKMRIINNYLDNLEKAAKEKNDKEAKNKPGEEQQNVVSDSELLKQAIEKTNKDYKSYFARLLKDTRQEYYNRYFEAVAHAFDPHTDFMPPTSKEDFDIHMRGTLEGIGALLREDGGNIKVVRIIPGSAAKRQGQLQAEDIILGVAEGDGEPVDITGMRIREAVSYIRGPKGTEVRLTVQKPDSVKKVIPIVRDVVQIEDAYVKSTVLENKSGNKIGYIRVPSFYRDFAGSRNGNEARNVTNDIRSALTGVKKQKITSVILDLRNNGGGSLSDAVDVSGLFLPGGPVVQVKNSHGIINILEDTDENVFYKGTVIVLVNTFSASASEILAAALQDYDRALVIGAQHTHGKGTVQGLFDLNKNVSFFNLKKISDLGSLKITVQKFYRINGGSTQYKGVSPDIIMPTIYDYLESGEKYLDFSLPWDQVKPLEHHDWQGATLDRDKAKKLAAAWLENNLEVQKVNSDLKLAAVRKEKTTVPVYLEGVKSDRLEFTSTSGKTMEDEQLHDLSGKTGENEDGKLSPKLLQKDPMIQLTLYLLAQLSNK